MAMTEFNISPPTLTTPAPIPWGTGGSHPGPWLTHLVANAYLVHSDAYPPIQLRGFWPLALNGHLVSSHEGSWQFSNGVVYWATSPPASRSRDVPSVAQRALLLLAYLEVQPFSDAPEGAIDKLRAQLLEKLVTSDKKEWRATVTRLTDTSQPAAKRAERDSVSGIALIGEGNEAEIVILSGGKWFNAAGAEVAQPTVRAQWAD